MSDDIARTILKREEIFESLIDQSKAKNSIVDQFEHSRSTIDRAVTELSDAGLIYYNDGVWEPTPVGRYAFELHKKYVEQLGSLTEFVPLLQYISFDSLDPVIFESADVYRSDPQIPDLAVETFLEHIDGASELQLATPTILLGVVDELQQRVCAEDIGDFEIIVPEGVCERVENSYPTLRSNILEHEDFDVYCESMPFSFGLWISDDDHMGVIIFTNQGIAGIIVNNTSQAMAWAKEQFREVRPQSGPKIPQSKM